MAYIAGDPWCICDVCGFKVRKSVTKKRWDGAIVCQQDFETRHPLDTIRSRSERQAVVDARPEPAPRFVEANEVQPGDL